MERQSRIYYTLHTYITHASNVFFKPIFSFLFGWMRDQSLHVAFLHSEAAGTS